MHLEGQYGFSIHSSYVYGGRCPLSCLHRGRLQRELPGERGTTAGNGGRGRKNGDPRASSCREWENPWDFLGKIMEILGDILISWGFMGFI
jgi:hypothetical protein